MFEIQVGKQTESFDSEDTSVWLLRLAPLRRRDTELALKRAIERNRGIASKLIRQSIRQGASADSTTPV